MQRDGSRIPRSAQIGNWSPKTLKPRHQKDQTVVIMNPVHSIGRFFGKLPKDIQKEARDWARHANKLARPNIEAAYRRFEGVAKYANYA